jgi:ClpP class serine protease
MWLIQNDALQHLEDMRATRDLPEPGAFFAREDEDIPRHKRIMQKAGGTASISINGVMTESPDLFAMLFAGGNTTYPDIISAIGDAEQDSEIERIELKLNSPGGMVSGLFDVAAAVSGASKPTTAVVGGKAASAGYILAAACNEIEASNPTSSVGSFGVAVEVMVREGTVTITNSDSPDKRPDYQTEEGQAVVRDHLDSLHAIFADIVGEGRGIDPSLVTERFGRGRMYVASEAMARGMIDRIRQTADESPASGTTPTEAPTSEPEMNMDLDTLKAEHPAVYRAALEVGAAEERDRVMSHLTMGQESGDMETAAKAIEEGSGMTATLQARYMAAGMRRTAIEDRGDESAEAEGAAAAGAAPAGEQPTSEEAHAEAVAELLTSNEVV